MGCGASSTASVPPGKRVVPPLAVGDARNGDKPEDNKEITKETSGTAAAAQGKNENPVPLTPLSQTRAAMADIMEVLMKDSVGLNSVIFTITQKAPLLIQAKACTVYLVDKKRKELWSVATDSGLEFRIPLTAGIAGEVGRTGNIVNIPDCYADSRWATAWNLQNDEKNKFKTNNMLVFPIKNESGSTVGVLQFLNKFVGANATAFTKDDENTIRSFVCIAATHIENSQMYKGEDEAPTKEADAVFGGSDAGSFRPINRTRMRRSSVNAVIEEDEEMEEGDEEEEDDD